MRNLKGIPEGQYICSTCKQTKDSTEFHWYEQTTDGRGRGGNGKRKRVNGSCRECRNKLANETRNLKKEVLGFVPQPEYGELCEACHRPVYANQSDIPQGVDGTYAWMFDHCHDTVRFRGWICNPCNTGFGLLGDNAESVKYRLKYLIQAEENRTKSQELLERLVQSNSLFHGANAMSDKGYEVGDLKDIPKRSIK